MRGEQSWMGLGAGPLAKNYRTPGPLRERGRARERERERERDPSPTLVPHGARAPGPGARPRAPGLAAAVVGRAAAVRSLGHPTAPPSRRAAAFAWPPHSALHTRSPVFLRVQCTHTDRREFGLCIVHIRICKYGYIRMHFQYQATIRHHHHHRMVGRPNAFPTRTPFSLRRKPCTIRPKPVPLARKPLTLRPKPLALR